MGNLILGRVNINKTNQEKNKSLNNTDNTVNQNINIHTHSQFFENDSDKSTILGINNIIKT